MTKQAGDGSVRVVMVQLVQAIQAELSTADMDDIDSVPPQVMHDIIAMINSLAYVCELLLTPSLDFEQDYEQVMYRRLAAVSVLQIGNGHTEDVADDAVYQ